MSVTFFSEDISFQLETPDFYSNWIERIITSFPFKLQALNYIFCSDDYLLQINRDHLQHDYFTDIITFDNSESESDIEGDVFISIDRVKENAQNHLVSFENELSRVLAHGLLHLMGYSDKTDEQKLVMREKEEACISLQEK